MDKSIMTTFWLWHNAIRGDIEKNSPFMCRGYIRDSMGRVSISRRALEEYQ
jgi:hypothetical protein